MKVQVYWGDAAVNEDLTPDVWREGTILDASSKDSYLIHLPRWQQQIKDGGIILHRAQKCWVNTSYVRFNEFRMDIP